MASSVTDLLAKAPESTPQTQVTLGGKVIAITGANRGIGLGIAECCLSNGATKVYSIDIGETGEDFAALSKRYPGQLFAVVANVTEESTISAAIDKIIEEAGALHGMVVNAGAYVYLLSEAASYTTSIDIPVNGVIGIFEIQKYEMGEENG